MKKLIPLILSFSLILTGCYFSKNNKPQKNVADKTTATNNSIISKEDKIDKKNNKTNKNLDEKPEPKEELDIKKSETKKSSSIIPTEGLNTQEKNWYFLPKAPGELPGCDESPEFLKKYDSYYLGDTSKKVIYLTFDEGYENGYSSKILDILKNNNVKAAFFVTTPYINSNKDLVKRMVDEGHLVCNHSTHHPSMPSISDESKFNDEILTCEKTFKELTGKEMPKFFRPPMGKYSELSLARTKNLGYKTILWSFAYNDWDVKKQPSIDYAKNIIKKRTHNGGIFLLHAVSKTNTEILDSIIKDLKNEGYTFESLYKLP